MAQPAETALDHAGALLALLEQEHQALQGGDPDRLLALCRDKLLRLRQLDALRGVALNNPALRTGLRQLVERCQQQTALNEALLQARFNRSRSALAARRGAPGHYDVSGRGQYEVQRNFRIQA
jgi:flagellar biosynthesis/type III secretory pathway chaperone